MYVTRSLADVKGHLIEGDTKTGRNRRVGIRADLLPELREHLTRVNPTGTTPDALVFPGDKGGYLRHGNFVRRYFRPAVKATLPPELHGLRFHDLRHTCAALLIASGANPKDIPAQLISTYTAAAKTCPGMPWTVLAAIAKVETDHGRHGDARLSANGDVRPPIIGIPLNGAGGTQAIRDTDNGALDGDTTWDRAVGPLQFIPATWARFGEDANNDGVADPHNFFDAVRAAARYLCANGAGVESTLRAAVLAYNHAASYADEVLATAERYAQPVLGGPTGEYALPVARELLTVELLRRPHHDYPAWDLALPTGTPVYAVHGGTVLTIINDDRCGRGLVIAGHDGATYTYCHGDVVTVNRGQAIAAGGLIMLSGNTGRSTGPHLHLQVRSSAGSLVCPQALLAAWTAGRADPPSMAPTTGCTT